MEKSSEKVMVYVNDEPVEYDGESLYEFLQRLGVNPESKGVAVAVNLEVIARDKWRETKLKQGDKVEIVHAVSGG